MTRKDVGRRIWNNLSHRRKVLAMEQGALMFTFKWGNQS